MLRNWAGQAICEDCYDAGDFCGTPWKDLPVIMPNDLTLYFPGQAPQEFVNYLEACDQLVQRGERLRAVLVERGIEL